MSASDLKYTRRIFVRGGVAAVGLAVLAPTLVGCGKEEEAGVNCSSPPGLTPDQSAKRTQFSYVEASTDPAKTCAKCTFFPAGAPANACGNCTLGLGDVNPNGTCTAFAARA